MKKLSLGVVLLIGLCATLNAQLNTPQLNNPPKANKLIAASITWNNVDGYFLTLQPLGYFSYDVLIDIDGQQEVVTVSEYVTCYPIAVSKGSKVVVKVIGWKGNPLTFVVN